ncbi:MAG: 5-(carboxyamino)imidazole ribonucleotide mutase [Faecalicoccus sp.]|nr:5-(carboxyamino)imidazole ribonucleotide mutase [Faecalicoccus sp.]
METKVLIVMGSRSDLPSMEGCMKQLDDFGVGYEVRVLSAHRTPNEVIALSASARDRGIQVIIAAAGGAAHLAGVLASSTPLPVIGIPIQTSALGGMDSLLSTVQMPQGVPVATVAIGKAGARNAAILAVQMMGLGNPEYLDKIAEFKKEQAEKVLAQSVVE